MTEKTPLTEARLRALVGQLLVIPSNPHLYLPRPKFAELLDDVRPGAYRLDTTIESDESAIGMYFAAKGSRGAFSVRVLPYVYLTGESAYMAEGPMDEPAPPPETPKPRGGFEFL
jgi:hypothetical protein